MQRILILICACRTNTFYLISVVLAAEFTGSVVSVLDGDTIEVLHNGKAERIRLSGIDCPENGQAYSKKAKQAASALAFGKEVTVKTRGQDRYKRILGEVILPDGMNLNQELVRQGWCQWYRKYAPTDAVLEELEKPARAGQQGLWADPHPVPPWEWRRFNRECRFLLYGGGWSLQVRADLD